MQAPEKDVEGLQEKASELYLQGEFRQALAVWRELLERAPDHERAREGVRLCEVLAEQMEAAGAAEVDRPAAEPPPVPPPVKDDADPLDIDLSALNLDGGGEPAPAAATTPELPDPARQGEGIDLGDPEAAEALALATGGSEATASATAASELHQRVSELLAEARRAQQDGDIEQALSLVGRVFILDEENAAARELQESLTPEQPQAEAKTDTDEDLLGHLADPGAAEELPSLDLDDLQNLDLEEPPGLDLGGNAIATEPRAAVTAAPPMEEPELPALAGDLTLPDDAVLEQEDAVIDPDAAEAPVPVVTATKKTGLPAKPLILAGGAVVLAAAGFFVSQKLSGPPPEQGASTSPAPASAVSGAQPSPQGATPAPVPDAAAEPTAPAAPTEDLQTLIARARAAFEAGDYAASVMAYNEVIRLEPANVEAQDRLVVAGERYRERQEILGQWERAIELFNQGDYRSSLVLLYRLPEDEDPGRLARYSRNGWYNMGLQSLQAGDCKTARGHFTEARTIDADDPAVQQALVLCRSCLNGEKGPAFYRTVNQLGYRGLED